MKFFIKSALLRIHKLFIKLGLYIYPVNYYVSIPNIIELKKTKHIWAKKSEMFGIDINLERQIKNLFNTCEEYKEEYIGAKNYKYATENKFGPGYGFIESQALHSIIRKFKPKRVIEVGSGVSTYCILEAIKLNLKDNNENQTEVTCIEPFPSNALLEMNEIRLVKKKVQEIKFDDEFSKLSTNDLLFIDSSHTTMTGSDVNYLILEILPKIKKGVIIHFHDIFFPYDYNRDFLNTFYNWGETSLLRAFLINNSKFEIYFCMSQIHYDSSDVIMELFPEYNPQIDEDGMVKIDTKNSNISHFPSSIYLKVV